MSAQKESRFNRCKPLLEKKHVPCEVISIDGRQTTTSGVIDNAKNLPSKRREYFTLRILEGHRTNKGHGRLEKAIRLEISDEYRGQHTHCNVDSVNYTSISFKNGKTVGGVTPFSPLQQYKNNSVFSNNLDSCRKTVVNWEEFCPGNGEISMEDHNHSNLVQLYELEVGESDFAELQQDQALLVDFENFSNSFIQLLNLCDLGKEDGTQTATQIVMGNEENKENGVCSSSIKQIPSNPLFGCQLSATSGMIGQNCNSSFISHMPFVNKVSAIDKHVGSESMYTCRIEEYTNIKSNIATNSWNNSIQKSGTKTEPVVRFSIVESNQFRELTHLSLNLSIGSDASIKSYLSVRLHESIGSIAMLKHKLNRENIRATDAEQSCKEIEKRFNEMINASQEEKNALVNEVDETIQKQNTKMFEEMKILQETNHREIQAIKSSSERKEHELQTQVEELQTANIDLEAERDKLNGKNIKLSDCLQEQEKIAEKMSLERRQLSNELSEEKNKRMMIESQLCETQEVLTSLEQAIKEKDGLLNQMEDTMKRSSQEAQETNAQSESCAVRLRAMEQELGNAKEELSKTKELLGRYQSDRQEMKRRMKSKVDLIQKQEEILSSNEINSMEMQQRMERSEKELLNTRHEMELMKQKLDEAHKTIKENEKNLESNQQVITWLNKEVNEKKQTISTATSLHTTNPLVRPSTTYVGQSCGNIFPRNFETSQKPSSYQYNTPLYTASVNASCQPTTFMSTMSSNVKTSSAPPYNPNQRFVPKVTPPNPILKTPSKAPIKDSRFVTSESLSDTQPRKYTPTAMNVKR